MRTIVSVGYGGRPPCALTGRGADPIDLGRQRRKVDVRLDLGQRIAQRVDLLAVMIKGEQVGLDGSAADHGIKNQQFQNKVILPKGRGEVFRGAHQNNAAEEISVFLLADVKII